jgi:hypothetical protein
MPGIARYTQNRVSEGLWNHSESKYAFECDGIVELEFRDEQSMVEANASETVRTLLPQDELNFLAAITLCRVPIGARQTWDGKVKAMLAGKLARASSLTRLHEFLGGIEPRPAEFSIDLVLGASHREELDFERDPPNVFATLWFDPHHSLKTIFGPTSHWSKMAPSFISRGTLWRCDTLAIVESSTPEPKTR